MFLKNAKYYEFRRRDSSVGTPTDYGLDSRSSNPSRGKILLFSPPSRPALGPTQAPTQWATRAFSPGIMRPGHQADHSPPFRVNVKNC
jgi:hypothetical protein